MPLDTDGKTGGACDPCTMAMLGHIRREAGRAYHLVVSRSCARLFEEVNRLLQPWSHLKVVVDRRYMPLTHGAPPPRHPGLRRMLAVSPRSYHLVIRRDCAHLYEDLAPLFEGRPDVRVLVDRRSRSRTLFHAATPPDQTLRAADPPAWLV